MFKVFNKLNLRVKSLPPILLLTLVILIIGGVLMINSSETATRKQSDTALAALKEEQESTRQEMLRALKSKADIIGKFMAKTAPELILSYDFSALRSYQKEAASDSDVRYAAYLKPDESPFIKAKKQADTSDIIQYRYPIVFDDKVLGNILIGMSTAEVNKQISNSNSRIDSVISKINTLGNEILNDYYAIISFSILGVMATISLVLYLVFQRFIIHPINETTALIRNLAAGHGDLTVRLPLTHKDEIGSLRQSLNEFIIQLQGMISSIVKEAEILNENISLMQNASSIMSQETEAQRHETSQVATAMNQMTTTVQEVAKNAEETSKAADEGKEQSVEGQNIVNETVASIRTLSVEVENASDVITKLEADSEKIGMVLDVINGIAEQTNLLALNAAIEAARAGEQGRGFAVVADEVRTLASRTHQSTLEIRETIEHVQQGTHNVVQVMHGGKRSAEKSVAQAEQAGSALNSINRVVSNITNMTTQIAIAAKEQSGVAEEINKNILNINSISERVAEGASNTSATSQQLMQLSERLQKISSQFKI